MFNKIKEQLYTPVFFISVLCILALFWVVVRFYNLEQNYLFISDAGRDAWVLWQWYQQGKIPFLGPGVSALPMNTSPVYFYILFPFFVVTKQSYFFSHVALFVYCWFFVILTALIAYPSKKRRMPFLFLMLLLMVCPQFVAQSRSVWNPSFTIAPLVTAFYLVLPQPSTLLKLKNWLEKSLALSGTLVALATSLNMSVVPAAVAFGVLSFITARKKALWWLAGFIGGMVLFYIPTILFEIKHSFQITNRMISTLQTGAINGSNEPMFSKFLHLLSMPTGSLRLGILISMLVTCIGLYILIKSKSNLEKKRAATTPLLLSVLGLLLTISLSLLFPLRMEVHYIFGVLLFMVLGLVSLPAPMNYLSTLCVATIWAVLLVTKPADTRAFRTVEEFDTCMREVTTKISQPIYVAVQSGAHQYHEGQEFRFGLAKHGIAVKDISTDPDAAQLMIVFNEKASFVNGVDSFHELTLFGTAEVLGQGKCSEQLGWTILKR